MYMCKCISVVSECNGQIRMTQLHLDWFPVNLTFTMLFILPPSWTFSASAIAETNQDAALFSLTVFPANRGINGITVETLPRKRQSTPLMEKAKKMKRESDRNHAKESAVLRSRDSKGFKTAILSIRLEK